MTSRTLRIVVTDIEAEWLVPVTASKESNITTKELLERLNDDEY